MVLCPSVFCTVTFTLPEVPAGTTQLIAVEETSTEPQEALPILTIADDKNPVPLIVIIFVPAKGPAFGEIELITGAAW